MEKTVDTLQVRCNLLAQCKHSRLAESLSQTGQRYLLECHSALRDRSGTTLIIWVRGGELQPKRSVSEFIMSTEGSCNFKDPWTKYVHVTLRILLTKCRMIWLMSSWTSQSTLESINDLWKVTWGSVLACLLGWFRVSVLWYWQSNTIKKNKINKYTEQ